MIFIESILYLLQEPEDDKGWTKVTNKQKLHIFPFVLSIISLDIIYDLYTSGIRYSINS